MKQYIDRNELKFWLGIISVIALIAVTWGYTKRDIESIKEDLVVIKDLQKIVNQHEIAIKILQNEKSITN